MSFMTILGMILLAFLLGVRHGIDWDHITAIVDLVGGESDKRRGFLLTLWYAAGHELVIIVFGCVAVLLGVTLPHWVDGIMERVVGVTLLILAVVFVISLIRDDNEPMISRWRLLFVGFYNLFGWMAEKVDGQRRKRSLTAPIRVNRWGAFGIGIIHGIGAETPTQLLMFATASGLGSPQEGFMAVMSFVVGLLCTHVMLALISMVGYVNAARHRRFLRGVGFTTAFYSLFIGCVFTLGYATALPTL